MNRGLFWFALVSCWPLISGAADGTDGRHSLTVRILGPNGSPADGSITLWRAVAEPQGAERALGFRQEGVWRETTTGKTWQSVRSSGAGRQETITGLSRGDYRVSATLGNAVTPFGLSDVTRLDDSSKAASVSVRIAHGSKVTLSAVAADTGKPVTWFQALVRRDDGFPVTRWSSSPWPLWSRQVDGLLIFDELPPGNYSIEAGARAWNYGDQEYVAAKIPLKVDGRKPQRVSIPLQPRELPEDEVGKRWPFIVTGKVTDRDGRGIGGVRIMAHCGMGTLMPTGETQSLPDGSYTLRFRPGMWSTDGGKPRTVLQVATIHPGKEGYAEANLHRSGDLMMADELPGPDDLKVWGADTNRIVLKGKPCPLDFVMIPAGRLEGRLIKSDGKLLANERIEIDGDPLPPSSSILAASKTDRDGQFEFHNVPVKREWWFVLPDKRGAQSGPVTLEETSTQACDLILRSNGKKQFLELRKR